MFLRIIKILMPLALMLVLIPFGTTLVPVGVILGALLSDFSSKGMQGLLVAGPFLLASLYLILSGIRGHHSKRDDIVSIACSLLFVVALAMQAIPILQTGKFLVIVIFLLAMLPAILLLTVSFLQLKQRQTGKK
ncbi:hypothetical protein [Sediminibacterium ginsengisoli]|nr:hypothetical protein [Sediminibacterium ginsengisoli]